MKQRNIFWDNYKGILIFLVVFGHFIYSYAQNIPDSFVQNLYIFIYSFHMPAFIFCSGYFSKSIRSRSKESLINLLMYYIVFNTLMMLFAYFYMGTNFKILTPYYSYWYILSLIIWRIVINFLSRVKGIIVIALIISLSLGYWSEFTNLLSLRRTVAFFIFFVAGYLLDNNKFEQFLSRRKTSTMIFCSFISLIGAVIVFWAVKHFKITNSMTLMSAYKNTTDIFCRILIIIISLAAIMSLVSVLPNKKIPFLSQIGKNSLLIYLAHRFFTIIFYKELFNYKTYSRQYIIYAFVATIILCIILGNEKLNRTITTLFNKATASIIDFQNTTGNRIITIILIIFTVIICTKTTPLIKYFARENPSDDLQTTAQEQDTDNQLNELSEFYTLSTEQKSSIENSVKLSYVGDLILLKDQITSAYEDQTGNYDFDKIFEYAKPYLTNSDFSIGVFEGPAAGSDYDYSTSNYGDGNPLYLNFPDDFAQAVKNSGIDLVSTANNHLLDMGVDGAMRTLDILDNVGLLHTGSYRNQTEKDSMLIIDVDGIKIAVLSYLNSINYYKIQTIVEEFPYLTSVMPYSSNDYYDNLLQEIKDDFTQAKESDADLILVMAHMGTQFQTSTNAFQNKWNSLFAELGADIILGDHAHAIQPIEYIGNTVVINCPGNFANSYIAYNGDATSIVEIYINRDTKEVVATSIIPMYTQELKKGYFRALPIYDIMTNESLYNELWSQDRARIQEVQKLITEVMLKESISLQNVCERYFYINNHYYHYDS